MALTNLEFAQATRQAAVRVGNLTDDGVRAAREILQEMQRELLHKLAQGPTEYGEWYYNQLLKDVDRLYADLNTRYTDEIGATLDSIAETITDSMDQPLKEMGLILDLPRASRQTVEFMTGFAPGELIGGLTQAGKQRIQTALQQALLGVKTPWELQQLLAKDLEVAGPFRTIAERAEAIWRTEAGRVFNTLARERYRRVEAKFPGRFEKEWLHSGNVRNPREHHQKLDGQRIGINEKFLVGGFEADGPHDPALPVGEVIKCGCTAILTPVE